MAASLAMIGYNTTFSMESLASPTDCPPTFIPLAEIKNVSPPKQKTDTVDVSHNTSPGRIREYVAGLIDPGEASFEMNFVPGTASAIRVEAGLASGTVSDMLITFPNTIAWAFQGIITGYDIKAATADAMTATVTIKVTGTVSIG